MNAECRICGESTRAFTAGKDEKLYHRCPSCDYVALDSRQHLNPTAEKRRYQLHENNPGDSGYMRWLEAFLDFALVPRPAPGCRVLDFGSGPNPVLALLLEERGYLVSIEDPFFAPVSPQGPFDLITAVEVFEHMVDPVEGLASLHRRLNPGGRIVVSTEFLPLGQADFDRWPYRSDSTHIGFFSQKTLTRLADGDGLDVCACDGVRYIAFTDQLMLA